MNIVWQQGYVKFNLSLSVQFFYSNIRLQFPEKLDKSIDYTKKIYVILDWCLNLKKWVFQ